MRQKVIEFKLNVSANTHDKETFFVMGFVFILDFKLKHGVRPGLFVKREKEYKKKCTAIKYS